MANDLGLTWGAYEDAGGNSMRVGIRVLTSAGNDGAIVHGTTQAKFTVEYYTQNRNRYTNDTQSMNLGGAIGGTLGPYNNNEGTGQILRDTKYYFYDYGPNEYGSGGPTKTFTATVVGAVNGVKPSHSRTPNVPDRPIDNPAKTTACTATRISDGATTVTWVNHPTSGEPYGNIHVARQVLGYGSFPGNGWAELGVLGGGAVEYTDSTVIANRKWQYYTQVSNNAGNSGFDLSGILCTTPAAPINCARSGAVGADQSISWAMQVLYPDHQTEVRRAQNGNWALIAVVGSGVSGYVDPAPAGTSRWKYTVRTYCTQGEPLYSGFSNETSETDLAPGSGPSYTVPDPPTNLTPANGTVLDQAAPYTLGWKHNPTDGSPQTRYQLRHREQGTSTWTTVDNSSGTGSYSIPAGTYANSKTVEWQVSTWGYLSTGQSGWSALSTFVTTDPVPRKYALFLDVDSGRVEASSAFTPTGGGGGGSGGTPTGAAGGQLTGSYPNPQIAPNAVTSSHILDGTIITADLADGAVTSAKIADGSITAADLAPGLLSSQYNDTQMLTPVRVCADTNIALAGLVTIDGLALAGGDRVLLRGQTTSTENGIYVAATGTWVRATDADTAVKVARGMRTRVLDGTAHRYKTMTQMSATPGDATGQVWDLVTSVDTGGMFTYPVPQNAGQLYWDGNQHALSVWNGSRWEFSSQVVFCTSATRPGPFNQDGLIIYETDTLQSYIWVSSQWKPFGGSTGGGGAGSLAVGSIIGFGGAETQVPVGYLPCDGKVYNKSDFPDLFNILTGKWGGDGTLTFAVPDLRGRSLVGVNTAALPNGVLSALSARSVANSGGEESHKLVPAEVPSHNHNGNTDWQSNDHSHSGVTDAQGSHQHGYITPAAESSMAAGSTGRYIQRTGAATDVAGNHSHNVGTYGASANHYHNIAVNGSDGYHNNMQPFAAVTYIIRSLNVATGGGGGGGSATTIFTFNTASTNWVCTHNLNNAYVDVWTMGQDGYEVSGDVWHKDANTVEIHWTVPTAGTAYIG